MNKKTENLIKELEELVPIYVKHAYLTQLLMQKDADIVERYLQLGFTKEELEAYTKEVYEKLVEKQVVPPLEGFEEQVVIDKPQLITEL